MPLGLKGLAGLAFLIISSRILLSGSAKDIFLGSPHKVGLNREIIPEERGPKGETKSEIEDRKSFTIKSRASNK